MTDQDRGNEFVKLLAQNQRRLHTYVHTLVPTVADAEEIVQEATLVLWREFDQFQRGTNFTAWACKVAFHQVLAWRKKRQRDRLQFTDEFLTAIAAEAAADDLEERTVVLNQCVEKLPDHHRQLVRLRYSDGLTIEALAQSLRRTSDAIYRMLSRIRQSLHQCVTRTIQRET
jgi:RNA polymerase sigma-70 factor (ECF subfamily)